MEKNPNTFMQKVDAFLVKYRLKALKEVFLFALITIAIHLLFKVAAKHEFTIWGITLLPRAWFDWTSLNVFQVSDWVMSHILGMDYATMNQTFYFDGKGYVAITSGCSGLKQYLQVLLLFLIYPGPWKHKLWYIPLGIFVIYWVNIFRVIVVSIVMRWEPSHFDFV
ncbi:MAG: exosortase/archaeosortase family protein, partial [Bacteroidetes bacterium]|nr:exosortase/archaeosortase family protein [Bacteroidota bacterium]